MKALKYMFIFLLVIGSYSLDDVTKPYTFSPRDTIKSSKLNANWDTLYNRINQVNDSLDIKFARFTDFKDTTFDTIKAKFGRIDSITAPKHVATDSLIRLNCIRGNPVVDSIQGADRISGNPLIDSIQGMDNISGNPVIDSIQGVDKISGNPIIDSIQGADAISGNPIIDSISGNPWFSGTVRVDSLFSGKGIKGTNGQFSSTVNVDSLKSTKGIVATTGTFSNINCTGIDSRGAIIYAPHFKMIGFKLDDDNTKNISTEITTPHAAPSGLTNGILNITAIDSATYNIYNGIIGIGTKLSIMAHDSSDVFTTDTTNDNKVDIQNTGSGYILKNRLGLTCKFVILYTGGAD